MKDRFKAALIAAWLLLPFIVAGLRVVVTGEQLLSYNCSTRLGYEAVAFSVWPSLYYATVMEGPWLLFASLFVFRDEQ